MLPRHFQRSSTIHRASLRRPTTAAHRSLRQYRYPSELSRRCIVTRHSQPWRHRYWQSGLPGGHDRGLATAVEDYSLGSLPFHPLQSSTGSSFRPLPMPSYEINMFDATSFTTIPEPGEPAPLSKKNRYGIPGEVNDMLSVFNACLQVAKLERAALVLQRLAISGALTPEEKIGLHNQYLRASLRQIRDSSNIQLAEKLHGWYELNIRNKVLPHTAETIACMVKASLLSERGPRLERLIRRYMGMAPGEAGLQVLERGEILSDSDLAVITKIFPVYNSAMEEAAFDNFDAEMSAVEDAAEDTNAEKSVPTTGLKPTPQRGQGLQSLKSSMQLLAEMQEADLSQLSTAERCELQSQLEKDSITAAIEKWRTENKKMQKMGINTSLGPSSSEDSLSQHIAVWIQAMEEAIRKEYKAVEESETKVGKNERDQQRCVYGPIIQQSEPSRLAAITILTVLNQGAMGGLGRGITAQRLMFSIAKLVQEDIDLQKKDNAAKQIRRGRRVHFNPKEQAIVTDVGNNDNSDVPPLVKDEETNVEKNSRRAWSSTTNSFVGSVLLEALISSAKIRAKKENQVTGEVVMQYQPAFAHIMQPRKGKKTGLITAHPTLLDKLQREPSGEFLAKHLPMIVEPKPWKRINEGGFLESKTALVRVKAGGLEQTLYTSAALKAGSMKQVLKGLDILGKTPWKINKDVLGVMVEAWNSGEEIANMPPLEPKLDVPPEPDSSSDPAQRRRWMRQVKLIENERSGLHSQRCFMNLQLEIAQAFWNQTMYFPHNMDYRGRAYPMPSYLNHMGADHTRGLLKFAEGKALGVQGLRWLKIHLANLYGLDKASFDDRAGFADEHREQIIESATNPLKGSRWWLQAEDPWQCLSACFELKSAWESDNPTEFVSSLPVHQDGTCNGLQHYAALGGDVWGAKQVNLEPGDRPADVYSAVADLVKKGINEDAAENNQFAKALIGKVTRKVVKQTVMTNVYGVTFAGAKKQVCKQLDALYPHLGKEVGIPNIILATYIAKRIFAALATMFRGAHDIQYWLGEIGGRVCRALTPAQLDQIASNFSEAPAGKKKKRTGAGITATYNELKQQFRSSIVWTTPLRMPVVQPYRKASVKEIRTCLQTVSLPTPNRADEVHRKKQLQGFPPNFIHSLDATHMLLSALECHRQGLMFAAVHDSFWTHAADIDSMNNVIRESFIKIHEEDVVGRLATEFSARHKGSVYLAHIDSDTPIAAKIKELRVNSNLSPKEELLMEHKRNTLKLSGNPWDLEAAKKIVTPASVYEEMSSHEEDLEIKEEMQEATLGTISVAESQADENETRKELANEGAYEYPKSEEEVQHLMKMHGEINFENMVHDKHKVVQASAAKKLLPIWLPLTIPDVPKKGEFDVTRLRDSKYFFS